jgi:hypothetical protein
MPGSTWPLVLPGTYTESVEAVDAAEEWLRHQGKDMQSFCDILFNGDTDPHTSVFRIKRERYGIWNREGVPWPVDYIDDDNEMGAASHLVEHPHFYAQGEDDMPPPPPPSESEKSEKGEDATKMKMDGDDDEEEAWEDEEDQAGSQGDDTEEYPEDDEEDDDSENGSGDDSDDDEEGEDEGDEDGSEESDDEGEEDDESESENEDESEDESESEKEQEMPRLTIFAKMRGPKGWRKRAEIEELNQRNVFGFKVGVLDADGETPGTQEYNVRTEIQFIEQDGERKSGVLRIKLPNDMTPDDFTQLKSGWIIANVPYYDEDDA